VRWRLALRFWTAHALVLYFLESVAYAPLVCSFLKRACCATAIRHLFQTVHAQSTAAVRRSEALRKEGSGRA